MALTNLMTAITLDVYDHNATQTSIKSISCDSNTRFVRAALTYAHVPYKVSVNATVTLTVVRPDDAAVNIEGEAYNSGSANTDRIVAELTDVATAVKGSLLAQFKIEDGDQVLRTEVFKIDNGVALDIDSDKWADTYQGYDLSEFSAKIDDATLNLDKMRTASTSPVGKALVAKAVSGGKVTSWEFKEFGSGPSTDTWEVIYNGDITSRGGSSGQPWESYYDGSVTAENKSFTIPSLASLTLGGGETWRVTWDGTEYNCETKLFESDFYTGWCIGNFNFADGGVDDGTGEPFLLFKYGSFVGNVRTNGTHTLKLEKYVSGGSGNEKSEFTVPSLDSLSFAEGETWRVTWDGTEYDCNTELYEDQITWYIGNVSLADENTDDGIGEPFLMYNYRGFVGRARANGTRTLKLEKSVQNGDENPLKGKIATFTGDSICAGHGYPGGYAKIIGTDNNMIVENLGVYDGCVAPYSDSEGARFVINASIANMRSDAQYVILEGGGNDASYGVPLGTLTETYSSSLDTSTFAGAFENMLKAAIAKFPSAKIGYIFIHKCIGQFDSRIRNGYYDVAKAACEKWGIPYCDLNTQAPPLMYIDALRARYTLNADGIHPTEEGYRLFYIPKITAWLKTL